MPNGDLSARIDALLPQTQCTRCGYADCRAYATAIATGDTAINRCPPGGAPVIAALAQLLDRPVVPLDTGCGEEETAPSVAFVREAECIGCYKCAQVCPVGAFVGAPKYLHTVIEAECTGCELCLPVCPVDCIELRPRRVDVTLARSRADHSRRRYAARAARIERLRRQREAQRLNRQSAVARERRIAGYLDAARQRTAQRQRPPRPSTP